MIFAKYAFPDGVWEQLKQTIQSEGSYVNCDVADIGKICEIRDEEGNCTKYSDLYCVDIMWREEPLETFSTYEVFPNPIGVSTFLGQDWLYTQRFCDFNPLSPYCQITE
jgi:hypothetical protein